MKARNEIQKPLRGPSVGTDELKRARKLKPVKKEKNQRQSLFQEIDELEDIDLNYKSDLLEEEEFYDDEEEEDY